MAVGKLPKDLQKELEKAVRNFNSKVARLERKAEFEDIVYPDRVTVTQIKKRSRTASDLKEQINDLKKFSKRGSEAPVYLSSGAKVTKYEWNLYKRNYQRAKKVIERKIQKYESEYPTIAGRSSLLTYAESGDRRYRNLLKKQERIERTKIKRLKTKKEIEKIEKIRQKQLEKGKNLERDVARLDFIAESNKVAAQSKREYNPHFKKDFLEILDRLEYTYSLDPNKVEILRNAVTLLTPEAWSKVYSQERLLQDLREYYDDVGKGDSKEYRRNKAEITRLLDSIVESVDDIMGKYLKDSNNLDTLGFSLINTIAKNNGTPVTKNFII